MNKPMKSTFEAEYSAITRRLKESGTVEIGYDFPPDTFSQALDNGLK